MMHNEQITSLLAKSILQPLYLDSFSNGNTSLLDKGTTQQMQSQADKIRLFSAFICKVQHNFLWNDFLFTRKLLIRFKMELAAFREYLVIHQANRQGKPLSVDEKINRFIHFLKDHLLHLATREAVMVRAALLHEEAVRAIKKSIQQPSNGQTASAKRFSLKAIPTIQRHYRMVYSEIVPAELTKALTNPDRLKIYRRPHAYFYWYDPAIKDIRVLKFSKNMVRIIQQIEHKHSLYKILSSFSHEKQQEVKHVIKALRQCDVLYYE